ncbi:MAG: hypothetical protein NWF05_05885 [Candidatus Bathyarchaeota archaeon]|nr:hypothetical protein [Candidatus Bathyarchaeota archaeon]
MIVCRLLKVVCFIAVIVALMFSPLLLCCHVQSFDAAPTWLKKDVYMEYTLRSGFFLAPEPRVIVFEGTEIVENYTIKQFDKGVFRWICIDLDASTVKIEVVLSLWMRNESEPTDHKATLFVDPATRAVYAQNGTLLGTTHLWGPSHPRENQEMVLWDYPPDSATGTISLTRDGNPLFTPQTPQGVQKFYSVSNITGTLGGKPISFFPGELWFEYDTGLPVGLPSIEQNEPAISVFELKDLVCSVDIGTTNVDMGPAEVRLDPYQIFSYIAVGVGLTIMAVAIVRRRRKRR